MNTALRQLGDPAKSSDELPEASDPSVELNLFPAPAPVARVGSRHVRTCHEFPGSLSPLLEAALTEAETWLAQNQPAEFREALLALYFRLRSFQRTAELYDERFATLIEHAPAVKVRLFCLDPSHPA